MYGSAPLYYSGEGGSWVSGGGDDGDDDGGQSMLEEGYKAEWFARVEVSRDDGGDPFFRSHL